MTFTRLHLVTWLILATALGCQSAEKISLQNHFTPGQSYLLNTETDMLLKSGNGQSAAEGQKQVIKQTVELKVTPEQGTGNLLIQAVFTATTARIEMEGKAFDYDSENPANSPPFIQQLFGAFLQRSLTLVYDKDGNFIQAKDISPAEATPLGQGSSMNGQQLADALQRTLSLGLTDKPVSTGESWDWQEPVEAPPLGTLQLQGSSKLGSNVTESKADADLNITLSGSIKLPAAATEPLVEVSPASSFSGTVLYDSKKKLITNSDVATSAQLRINGQDITLTQRVRAELKVKP